APFGKLIPPACGKNDELKLGSSVPGTPCSRSAAWPAGASSTIDAGTRSPLTISLALIDTEFGPPVAQKSLNFWPAGGTRRRRGLPPCWTGRWRRRRAPGAEQL